MPGSDLLGLCEAANLLGLSRQAVDGRRRSGRFPPPVATLKATPVWTREQLVEYARERSSRLHERPAIEELSAEPVRSPDNQDEGVPSSSGDVVPLESAARMIGVHPADLREAISQWPITPGVKRDKATREILGIRRSELGWWASQVVMQPVETRARVFP